MVVIIKRERTRFAKNRGFGALGPLLIIAYCRKPHQKIVAFCRKIRIKHEKLNIFFIIYNIILIYIYIYI
jgi:hypothetical protein